MASGGKRAGAGRPKGTVKTLEEKTLARQSRASDMLVILGGDARWKWAIEKAVKNDDYRTVTDIMKYWTDRAEGKAAQAINLNQKEPIQLILKRDPEVPAVVIPDKPTPTAL